MPPLSADDVAWIRRNHIPEFIDSVVSELLREYPMDPSMHLFNWLASKRGPCSRPSTAGSRPSTRRQSIAERLQSIRLLERPEADPTAALLAESIKEPLRVVLNRRLSMPNLTMRTNNLKELYIRANQEFIKQLDAVFPGSMPEMDMVAKATKLLGQFGFRKGNAIPIISVCRDELTRSLVEDVEELWGPSFATGSIAGMVFCGKTGFMAGMAHAPQTSNGMERYIFISSAHIAISVKGEVGVCFRPGRPAASHACGSLAAMLQELKAGSLRVTVDTDDMEQSMMKQQLSGLLRYGEVPTLDGLTKCAQKLIKQQVESTLSQLSMKNKEYAFLSGIQIHGPDNANFFWLTDFYIQKLDVPRQIIDPKDLQSVDASELIEEIQANDYARVMSMIQEGDMERVMRWIQTAAISQKK